MSEKRRDNKNRILREGESQREDGRYCYKYKDYDGKIRYVYSWKLDIRDTIPAGKRRDLSLREKEKAVKEKLEKELIAHMSSMQLIEVVERYTAVKTGVKESTKVTYKTIKNLLRKYPIAYTPIDRIKFTDAKRFMLQLREDGYSYNYIHSVYGVLNPAFEQAIQDDLIIKNPFSFKFYDVVKNDSVTRKALTEEQEEAILAFTKTSRYKRVYPVMYILFNTGMRISEYCGLTIPNDLDFKNRRIIIRHQMLKINNVRHVTTTKSKNGERVIPMTDEVAECFKEIIDKRGKAIKRYGEPMVDGHIGFLHVSQGGVATTSYHWEKMFRKVCALYNQEHPDAPIYFTPHTCRHTFCTKMVRRGMNPKSLQYIMGHGDVSFTMNEYTHIDFITAERDFKNAIDQ